MILKNNQLLTIKELSKMLNIREGHIRSLVFKKEIPFLKIGKLIRFCPENIKIWIERNSPKQKR